jgi:hypothetical protein
MLGEADWKRVLHFLDITAPEIVRGISKHILYVKPNNLSAEEVWEENLIYFCDF